MAQAMGERPAAVTRGRSRDLAARSLDALGRSDEAADRALEALVQIDRVGYRRLSWRLHALRARALAAAGQSAEADSEREKAREILAKKKQGEKLEVDGVEVPVEAAE